MELIVSLIGFNNSYRRISAMRFSINGQDHEITREKVINGAHGTAPAFTDNRHKYFVRLEDRRFPIKQLLANATGLNNSEFTAQYAQRILRKLGFTIEGFDPPPPRVHFSSKGPSPRNGGGPGENQDSMQFAVTLESDEDGFYVSSCPALPGCHSQGRDRDDALSNISQAIRGYLASMQKHGETLPDERWEVVEVVL